jgi:DNA repair protein RadD
MSRLRGFQISVKQECYRAWAHGARVVMPVMPTGSGKTVLIGDIAREYPGDGCAIAHRSELVGQISVALAREGVRHDIIAPKGVIREIVKMHMEELGRSFYDARARWKVASVDTILRRELDPNWMRRVGLVFEDEGHHVLRDNKWGRAFCLFENARGCFPTATAMRPDGRGLGSHADGLVDALVEGPSMRWLIDHGYLTDYHLRLPQTEDLDLRDVEVSAATGDYVQEKMRKRVKSSLLRIGDIVKSYQQYAMGLKTITFAVDVEDATAIADAFNRAGIAAQVVHAETPDAERIAHLRAFRKGELLQLVNVDLFGEGFDVPGVQCVQMARPTASYVVYCQQFGRMLRLMVSKELSDAWDSFTPEQRKEHIAASDKPVALLIDHVGNVIAHNGPPDWRNFEWTLDARSKSTRATDAIPLRVCLNPDCQQPYERIYPACIYCGKEPPPPREPTRPEHVDGDLVLYTPEMLRALLAEKERVDGPCYVPNDVAPYVKQSIRNKHAERQQTQQQLRTAMNLVMPPTLDDRVAHRRFFHTFGIDTLSAQALGSSEAEELRQRIIQRVTQ